MQKAQRFLEELTAQDELFIAKKGYRPWRVVINSSLDSVETFACDLARTESRLEAASPLAALYGYHRLKQAKSTATINTLQGIHRPLFPKRLIALVPYHQETVIVLSAHYHLSVPGWTIDAQTLKARGDFICRTLIAWGFNGLVLGLHRAAHASPVKAETLNTLRALVQLLNGYGLQLILAPHWQEAALPVQEEVQQLSQAAVQVGCSGLLLTLAVPYLARLPDKLGLEELTLGDLFERELLTLQYAVSPLDCYLNFSVPLKCDTQRFHYWLSRFPSWISPRTQLLFTPHTQEPWAINNQPHPLWKPLAEASRAWRFGLMPIVDSGTVGRGGGLWPLANFTELEQLLARCQHHPFRGALVTSASLPHPSTLAALNLGMAGWRLWQVGDLYSRYKRELESRFALEQSEPLIELLEENRQLISAIQFFRFVSSHEMSMGAIREETDLLLAQIVRLQNKAKLFSALLPELACCYRDLIRLVMYELQKRQQPLPKAYLFREEGLPGFWTEVEGGRMPAGYVASPRIRVTKVPLSGKEGDERYRLCRDLGFD